MNIGSLELQINHGLEQFNEEIKKTIRLVKKLDKQLKKLGPDIVEVVVHTDFNFD